MLIRTHLLITLFFILLLFPIIDNKIVFTFVSLVATFIPDIDSRFSKIGQKKIARVLQFFTRHRGAIHSFTFLFLITFILILFFPIVALGFFLGYGIHLLSDSFTPDGIFPFYPSKTKYSGKIKTGGKTEIIVFIFFAVIDLIFLVRLF